MADKVFLYALSTCIHCKNTKKFLESSNVDFDYIYLDKLSGQEREDVLNEVKKYNSKLSFPTLVIDDSKVIVGFKKDEILEALQK